MPEQSVIATAPAVGDLERLLETERRLEEVLGRARQEAAALTARARDDAVEAALRARGVAVHHYKDVVIFERGEVLTGAGTPFSVFTPYKNTWLKNLSPFYLSAYPVDRYCDRLVPRSTPTPAALTQDLYFYENSLVNDVQWATLQTIKGVSEGSMTRYAIQRFEPLKAELQSLLKALQDGQPVPILGEDGLAALKISLALVESGQSHQVVEIQ